MHGVGSRGKRLKLRTVRRSCRQKFRGSRWVSDQTSAKAASKTIAATMIQAIRFMTSF
jgi:hypothetical protein